MKCSKHQTEAIAVCAYCGRALCADCISPARRAAHGLFGQLRRRPHACGPGDGIDLAEDSCGENPAKIQIAFQNPFEAAEQQTAVAHGATMGKNVGSLLAPEGRKNLAMPIDFLSSLPGLMMFVR